MNDEQRSMNRFAWVIAGIVIGLAAYGVFALIDAAGGIACD